MVAPGGSFDVEPGKAGGVFWGWPRRSDAPRQSVLVRLQMRASAVAAQKLTPAGGSRGIGPSFCPGHDRKMSRIPCALGGL